MNRLSSMVETLPAVARRVLMTMVRRYVGSMLVTNHVLSGAVIGAVIRRPVPAFLLGVASHFALDAVPHWGKFGNGLLRVAVPDGLIGLATIGAMAAVAPPGRRPAVLAAMAGAALPDLDKPSKLFFGRSPYPRAVDQFHMAVQHEAPRRAHYEAVFAMVLASAAVTLLRGRAGVAGR
jgi:hypothetical protein